MAAHRPASRPRPYHPRLALVLSMASLGIVIRLRTPERLLGDGNGDRSEIARPPQDSGWGEGEEGAENPFRRRVPINAPQNTVKNFMAQTGKYNFTTDRLDQMMEDIRSQGERYNLPEGAPLEVNMTGAPPANMSYVMRWSTSDDDKGSMSSDTQIPPETFLDLKEEIPFSTPAQQRNDAEKKIFPEVTFRRSRANVMNKKRDFYVHGFLNGEQPGSLEIRDGFGTNAFFGQATALTFHNGTYYIIDQSANAIRVCSRDGNVTTLAGGHERVSEQQMNAEPEKYVDMLGTEGLCDGFGTHARFDQPSGIAVDHITGDVYVSDAANVLIRRITPEGQVTSVAGDPQTPGYEDGIGTNAQFDLPRALEYDPTRHAILIADTGNHLIRYLNLTDQSVHRLAGNRREGDADGPARQAEFDHPMDFAVTRTGDIYISDASPLTFGVEIHQNCIRKLSAHGQVSTVVGRRDQAYRDGRGSVVAFRGPQGLALNAEEESLFIADRQNNRIRRLQLDTSEVTTIAGWYQPLMSMSLAEKEFVGVSALCADDDSGFVAIAERPLKIFKFRRPNRQLAQEAAELMRRLKLGGLDERRSDMNITTTRTG